LRIAVFDFVRKIEISHTRKKMLTPRLAALNDPEGKKVPESLPFIVDAHVHVFPDDIFSSIRKWFKKFAWPIRYQLSATGVVEFLSSRGIGHIVAMQYAHKPGIARGLNSFMKGLCDLYGNITGMATVFPGEKNAADILMDAFQDGLSGVKLHAHVQCFDMNSEEMDEIYDICESYNKPLMMHVGREPKSPAYACDPYKLCNSEKLERVLRNYPGLRICVPHLGINEDSAYHQMIERYDNLWLDTAMVLTEYFPGYLPPQLNEWRMDRILYGTDFPNIPFAWDRELKCLERAGLSDESMELILHKNAENLYAIHAEKK
jgi:predicted TIM-barrel fold metal-dependent hydrolase